MTIEEKWGSGIPRIFSDFFDYGLREPELIDSNGDFRVNLYRRSSIIDKKVPIKSADKKVPIKSADKKVPIKSADKKMNDKRKIVDYLKMNSIAKSTEISELIGTGVRRARVILAEMVTEGTLIARGNKKNRIYLLNKNSVKQ